MTRTSPTGPASTTTATAFIDVALDHHVTVFPATGAGSSACVIALANELGTGTGGRAWHRQIGPTWAEIGAELAEQIVLRSQALCTVCDADGDGTPNACECPWDSDCDGTVGINDFLDLLAAWGPNPGHAADFDRDGIVGINDFLALLARVGRLPLIGRRPFRDAAGRNTTGGGGEAGSAKRKSGEVKDAASSG